MRESRGMLVRLELRNYRGFEDHVLDLRPVTVMVGQNNAGKSTIVEALRLISIVTQRISGLRFQEPPLWSEISRRLRGVSPSVEGLGIEFSSICHRYRDPPARVIAGFQSGERIECCLSNDSEAFAVLYDAADNAILSKRQMLTVQFPKVHILPQISPLESHETILSEEHVTRNMSSPLASRHFRNQLRLDQTAYVQFRDLSESTWPGLQIRTLEGARGQHGDELFLDVRDRDFVAEVGRMGHGLQMWLQTMWFLSRTPTEATVVLDEPDVYMHPDLQRRVIRLVRSRFSQVVVATHSVEIMAEVDPSEILIIDREEQESSFANSDPEVQKLVERLGGVHNLQLARLWTSRRCLFVEGKDIAYLKLVHRLLYPDASFSFDEIPNMSIGGWSGWPYAVGSSLFIRNAVGDDISVYCILDSDFHTDEEIINRLAEARSRNVRLHVWGRKEIENYFLSASAIARVINVKGRKGGLPVAVDEVSEKLHEIALSLRIETEDNFAEELYLANRKLGTKAANRRARGIAESAFSSRDGALAAVSGKAVLGHLASWSEASFGATLGVVGIARVMEANEIPHELKSVVGAIHHDDVFKRRRWSREWA